MTIERVWRKSSHSGENGSCVEVSDPQWRKSSYSGQAGSCVEVAQGDGRIAVRNSNDRDAGTVYFTRSEWTAFVAGVKDGEFDTA